MSCLSRGSDLLFTVNTHITDIIIKIIEKHIIVPFLVKLQGVHGTTTITNTHMKEIKTNNGKYIYVLLTNHIPV